MIWSPESIALWREAVESIPPETVQRCALRRSRSYWTRPTLQTERQFETFVGSPITHNDEAYIGALAILIAIRSAFSGAWSHEDSFLAIVTECIPDSAVRDRVKELLSFGFIPQRSPLDSVRVATWWTRYR